MARFRGIPAVVLVTAVLAVTVAVGCARDGTVAVETEGAGSVPPAVASATPSGSATPGVPDQQTLREVLLVSAYDAVEELMT